MLKTVNFFLGLILLLLSCNNENKQLDTLGADESEAEIVIIDSTSVNDSIIIPNLFERELVFDFNNDDQLDSLFLGADVSLNAEGRPIWDDAQNWFINIKILDSLQTVYSNSIQLGKLEVYFDEINNEIYILEKGPFQKEVYKLNKKNNFQPTKILKTPNTSNMVLLSID